MKISLGSDHGGFELKNKIYDLLVSKDVEVFDHGCDSKSPVDYPDHAKAVAEDVSNGIAHQGIIICTSGIGVSITANKFPNVRAALCVNTDSVKTAREHNNANVLCLGSLHTKITDAESVVDTWLDTEFSSERHSARVDKIDDFEANIEGIQNIKATDPEIYNLIQREDQRQKENIELIASENIASKAVRETQGSRMTNKYAEGYPAKRWYNGCEWVDGAETLAINRAKELFGSEHANVQPHSGSGANMAVYFSQLNPGDTILAMSLAEGGHLTHGHPMNFSGRLFNIIPYGVKQDTEFIDYENIQKLADEHKPKMIVAGASAYSRIIDFKKIREICNSVNALMLVDMAHISGLVASGHHPSPVPLSDFVTTTTHKTLRGPRGGLILCKEQFAADVDKQIFPGTHGGPLMHTIAGKAVCFGEALKPDFKKYVNQIILNAQVMAKELSSQQIRIVSGGTDNHLMLVDLSALDTSGKEVAAALDKAAITVNKNSIPFDKKSPFVTSGIRVGTPAVTTRGMREKEMVLIAEMIKKIAHDPSNESLISTIREEAISLSSDFPIL